VTGTGAGGETEGLPSRTRASFQAFNDSYQEGWRVHSEGSGRQQPERSAGGRSQTQVEGKGKNKRMKQITQREACINLLIHLPVPTETPPNGLI
jgi:hypothetical protein